MSGVYIKGIKLPTIHEGQMIIRIEPSGIADVQWSGMVGGDYTKAVEVPKHGRLIDADEFDASVLRAGLSYALTRRKLRYTPGEVRQKIADAPTVIEADRSEDGQT